MSGCNVLFHKNTPIGHCYRGMNVKQISASTFLPLSVYLLTTEIYLGILNHKWPTAGHILCLITALSYNSKSFPIVGASSDLP